GEGWGADAGGLWLPAAAPRRRTLPVGLDLFAGAGGFSLGFHQAGFHVAAACEQDEWAALTYLTNLARPGVEIHFLGGEADEERFLRALRRQWGLKVHRGPQPRGLTDEDLGRLDEELRDPTHMPGMAGTGWIASEPADAPGCEHFYLGDVKLLSGERVLADLGLAPGELDCVFGGPPCQGFSTAGRRDVMDPRNSLVFEFTRLVRETMPKTMVMENVPAMASMVTEEGIPVVDAIALDLERGGWGTLGAIRNMLRASSGVGAAVKPGEKPRRESHVRREEEEAEADDQLALEVE
ncbi:MAG TPA: DNA cytosine methyltransferase, partial [Solirubrobacterales bacterium]|nr:DNA cytosine methyltransferase [Solirubrobacterales bacterium]